RHRRSRSVHGYQCDRPGQAFLSGAIIALNASHCRRTTSRAAWWCSGDRRLLAYAFTIAQIFNLPYRRFVIGAESDQYHAPKFCGVSQSATLRYSRLQVCATGLGNTVNTYLLANSGVDLLEKGLSKRAARHGQPRRPLSREVAEPVQMRS